MFKASTTAIVVLFIAIAAFGSDKWPQEPSSFKDVPFGASKAEFEKLLNQWHSCKPFEDTVEMCFVMGLAPFRSAAFMFENNRLVQVIARYDAGQFESLAQTFLDKFGKPHAENHDELENRMGAKFDNAAYLWSGDKIVIRMVRYADDLNTGVATFTTPEFEAKVEAKMKAEREKAKKSF